LLFLESMSKGSGHRARLLRIPSADSQADE
jgi:hypothetical protein